MVGGILPGRRKSKESKVSKTFPGASVEYFDASRTGKRTFIVFKLTFQLFKCWSQAQVGIRTRWTENETRSCYIIYFFLRVTTLDKVRAQRLCGLEKQMKKKGGGGIELATVLQIIPFLHNSFYPLLVSEV